ncbi:MAG: class I SAM-dependent methyltransferase [Verrucomicrobiota bacterium]
MAFSLFRRGGAIATRTALLNHLISARGYRRYLEIGVRDPRQNFARVQAPEKHGVDPDPQRPISHKMTSDAFFAAHRADPRSQPYDLIFVDGLHLADQVERDILNGLAALSPEGTIALHDVNPLTADAQSDDYDGKKHWNGTVWKAWMKLRSTRSDLAMWVVDIDEGCGVIRRGTQILYPLPTTDYAALDYAFLEQHRQAALNVVSVDQFLQSF